MAIKNLKKLLINFTLTPKNFLNYAIKFQILYNSSKKLFTNKHLIDKLYNVYKQWLQNFLLNCKRENWSKTIELFIEFFIKSYKKIYFNHDKSHIFSSDHLAESS